MTFLTSWSSSTPPLHRVRVDFRFHLDGGGLYPVEREQASAQRGREGAGVALGGKTENHLDVDSGAVERDVLDALGAHQIPLEIGIAVLAERLLDLRSGAFHSLSPPHVLQTADVTPIKAARAHPAR